MQTRNKVEKETPIILGKSSDFEGDLKFYGTARLDGRFKGNISGEGTLEIGKEADIGADIHASRVVVYGEVRGKLVAEKQVEIKSSGKIFGDIETPEIIIEPGAYFRGNCQTRQPEDNEDEKEDLPASDSVKMPESGLLAKSMP